MRIDLSPLLRGEHGDRLSVAGVRVGGAAAGIDRHHLTGAEDDGPSEPRTFTRGTVFRDVAGQLVEIPLTERVEATLVRGGFLRCGDIALRVKDGRIERIFVRGPSLETLGFAGEDDIARAFGEAAGNRWSLGCREHHYPRRGLMVSWDPKERRVSYLQLGADEWVEPRLGAPALLGELLDAWGHLAPAWTEPSGGVARVRYQRVAALSRALGLGSVAELVDGGFLEKPLTPGCRRVLEELAAQSRDDRPVRDSMAVMVFRHLLHYRHDVRGVVTATSGWLECSDPALLGMIMVQDRIGAGLEAMMKDIDDWICRLLDADGRTFELRAVARHGWPEVDLRSLEMDEL